MSVFETLGAAEMAPGLWRWTAYHRSWRKDVGCLAIEEPDRIVLVDPLLPKRKVAWPAIELAIVLTVHFHRRSTAAIVERHPGARVWLEASAAPRRRGIPTTDPFQPGDILPGGLLAMPTARPDEVVLWHPPTRSLIAGDILLGAEKPSHPPLRMCPASWLPKGVGQVELARSLASLAYLPVERVIVSHGAPIVEGAVSALRAALKGAA